MVQEVDTHWERVGRRLLQLGSFQAKMVCNLGDGFRIIHVLHRETTALRIHLEQGLNFLALCSQVRIVMMVLCLDLRVSWDGSDYSGLLQSDRNSGYL